MLHMPVINPKEKAYKILVELERALKLAHRGVSMGAVVFLLRSPRATKRRADALSVRDYARRGMEERNQMSHNVERPGAGKW